MGYLNNSVITVDAILTKKGRELLAQGRGNFNITQFALSDDEVDYDLWNPVYGIPIESVLAHLLGVDKDGVVLLRPTILSSAAEVVGPDDLIEEVFHSKDSITHHLGIVDPPPVHVKVHGTGVLQDPVHFNEVRLKKIEIILILITVLDFRDSFPGLLPVHRLDVSCTERRVGIDEIDGRSGNRLQQFDRRKIVDLIHRSFLDPCGPFSLTPLEETVTNLALDLSSLMVLAPE